MSETSASTYTYLDYAATAPLCEEAAQAMAPYFVPGSVGLSHGANANSLHTPGRAAFDAMEAARKELAAAIGAKRPSEVIFCSGATEADNAALFGLVGAARERKRLAGVKDFVPHIITSAIEHDAVLNPAKRLEQQGCRVTYLKPDRFGRVSVESLERALDADTVLVSIMLANSELGTVEPIAQLAKAAHAAGALFHTDATQALGKIAVNVQELDVDAASFSAHKVGGPKGVGALYLKARTPFTAVQLGGGQETARRSGTQNVAGMAGFAAAASASVAMQPAEQERLTQIRDFLYARLAEHPKAILTTETEAGDSSFLPNIVHVMVPGFESETLILRLDKLGFGVSGGSACSSHSLDPSHVLSACGIPANKALCALRVSMGRYTTRADAEAFLRAFDACLDWKR